MNEVEKMYSNAGVKPYKSCYNCFDNNGKIIKDSKDCPSRKSCCNTCDTPEYNFTAEKQLELIKWLARKSHITIGLGLPWGQYDDDWWTVTSKDGGLGTNACKFEEALASFVNSKWQDLTEEERKQIRGILE